jgi:hypothetical protein
MSAFNVGDKIIFNPGTTWRPEWQIGAEGEVVEVKPNDSFYDYRINLKRGNGQESGKFPASEDELTAGVKHYFEVGEQFRYDRAYAAIPQDTVYTVKEIRSGQAVVSYAGGGEAYFSDNPDCKSHTIPVPPKSVHTFKVGDRLVYTPYVEGITYEITSLAEGNERYGVRWTSGNGLIRTERAEYMRPQDYKVVKPVVTHRFKVGDVIAGQQGSGTHYTVLALLGDPETYTVTWATGYPTTWRIADRDDVVLVLHKDKPQANLGLASTQELLDEIAARLAASENNGGK